MRDTLTCDLAPVVILGLNSLKLDLSKLKITFQSIHCSQLAVEALLRSHSVTDSLFKGKGKGLHIERSDFKLNILKMLLPISLIGNGKKLTKIAERWPKLALQKCHRPRVASVLCSSYVSVLPCLLCHKNGQMIFLSCRPNEDMWGG